MAPRPPDRSWADEPPRLFVAIPVPDAARDAVTELLAPIRAAVDGPTHRVRWVRLDGLHLTLRFFGPVAPDLVASLEAAVDAVAATRGPFDVVLSGGGAFPDPVRPRTLWVGVGEGGSSCADLARALEERLIASGHAPDGRPFRPHLTVARTDGAWGGPDAARRLVEAAGGWVTTFVADRIVLYRSELGGGPARYLPIHEARLVAASTAAG